MAIPNTIVVIGSGPGIGVATASLFASHAASTFTHVALISRDGVRLQSDRTSVLAAWSSAKQTFKVDGHRTRAEIDVSTWTQDVTDTRTFEKCLKLIEQKVGGISCVLFNAARVGPSDLLSFEESDILEDFAVCAPFHIFIPPSGRLVDILKSKLTTVIDDEYWPLHGCTMGTPSPTEM
jgi:NAD(P)-dependent dehydrogenase (short-subunit alcohol dehydrogenase family)